MFERTPRKVYLCNTLFKQTDNYKAFYVRLQRSASNKLLHRITYK